MQLKAPESESGADRLLEDWTESFLTEQCSQPPDICPVCGHQIKEAPVYCRYCGAGHHPECWKLMDGCRKCSEIRDAE